MIQHLDLYYIILDYAAPDIYEPIAILLIQILDIPFPHNANLSICHPLLGCQVESLLQCIGPTLIPEYRV